MRTIGLIGGMSWHSTESYYRRLNERVAERRGGHASARIALQSLDFAEVRAFQERDDWAGSASLIGEAARRTLAGGADLVALCTNLMHKNFAAVEEAALAGGAEAVHIADAVATAAARHGWTRVGLLGARWVMEEPFYADRLAGHGVEVLVPGPAGRTLVDRVVFEEITRGVFRDVSRDAYVAEMAALADRGAEAVVLACTEIGLLVGAEDAPLPVIDSLAAHTDLLAELALAG